MPNHARASDRPRRASMETGKYGCVWKTSEENLKILVGGLEHVFYFPFHIYIWDVIPTPWTSRQSFFKMGTLQLPTSISGGWSSCWGKASIPDAPCMEYLPTLWLCQNSYWKWNIYSGFTHWKWWFPIVMPVYQRVHFTQKWASFVGKYSMYGASGYFKPQPCRSRSGNIATTFQRSISDPIVTLLTWRLKITISNRYFLWNNI